MKKRNSYKYVESEISPRHPNGNIKLVARYRTELQRRMGVKDTNLRVVVTEPMRMLGVQQERRET